MKHMKNIKTIVSVFAAFLLSLTLALYGSQSFINQANRTLVAGPAVITPTSFFDDYDNLTYVDQTSLNNVVWDNQSAITYPATTGSSLIGTISAASGLPYQKGLLSVGQALFIDRGYTFVSVPTAFQGKEYIKTANDDKVATANNFLTFTLNSPATVYVAYEGVNAPRPTWLAGWTAESEVITTDVTDAPARILMSKAFSAGSVILGGANNPAGNNYEVIVVGGNSGPIPPGSFRSSSINAGPLNSLNITWQESVPGVSAVSFSTNDGSTWCPISQGQTLTTSTCFGGVTLRYKVDFPGGTSDQFQNINIAWQNLTQPIITYTISASAGTGGTITPSGTITVNQGASQTFAINPNSGYQIASVLVNGVSVGAVPIYTFANLHGDPTITQRISANFRQFTPTTPDKFQLNDRVRVTIGPVNVRNKPSTKGTRIVGTQPTNALGTVIGGPTNANKYIWWNINYDTGVDGWTVEPYLEKSIGLLPDITAPLVVLMSPLSGATVSGVTIISAVAIDPIITGQNTSGLAVVQLKVNGQNQGAEVTTAPYTIAWNTADVTNGTYLLTATARDNAGNTATSPNIAVTVSNATQPPTGILYYVDKNNVAANDANPGTLSAPWKTLVKAGASTHAGDTVYIRAGTYYETLQPLDSGTTDDPITFKAYPSDACRGAIGQPKVAGSCRVVIDGQLARQSGVSLGGHNYIRVEGFEIINHTEGGVANFSDWYATAPQTNGNQIVNNFIHNNAGDGVDTENSNGALIENNEIFANGLTAIRIGGQIGSTDITATGNNIHYNGKDGIQGSAAGFLFEGNKMYNQFHTTLHQDGFDIGKASNGIIRNNMVSDFTQLMYFPNDSGSYENIQIYGNIMYTDRYSTVNGSTAPGIFFDGHFTSGMLTNISIHSNTFGWVGDKAVQIYSFGSRASGLRIADNIFYDSAFDIDAGAQNLFVNNNLFYGVTPSGTNSVVVDPQFVNYVRHSAWDFRLKSTSPAIDKGALGSIIAPTNFTDQWGTVRPQGVALDIGAYEYKP